MVTDKLNAAIERYMHSTNKDKKGDFQAIINFISTNSEELEERELKELERKVTKHFVLAYTNNKEFWDSIPDRNLEVCNEGEAIAKMYGECSPEERKLIFNQFNRLFDGQNADTKAYLMKLQIWKIDKFNIEEKIKNNLKTNSNLVSGVELAYLQSAIEELKKLAKTNFEDFCEQYTKIGVRLRDQLQKETLLPTKEEKAKAFSKYTDMFKAIRQQVEESNGIYESLSNPFTCPECNVLNLFITRLQKRKEDEDIQQVFNDFLQTISYREMTQRTFPSSGLMRRFMLGATMYNLGYVDELGLYKVWSINGYLSDKELADKLPLELAEQIAQF